MKTVAIIQARMGSTRLPGKVMKPLCGIPMFEWLIERLRQSREIDQIVLATSVDGANDGLAEYAERLNIRVSRGSERDVLDRYYQAAWDYESQIVVRVTADCPLIDPGIVDQVVRAFREARVDYASNVDPPTYPDGLDVEVFSFSALERAWREAKQPREREHVTPYLRESGRFRARQVKHTEDLSAERWTIDEPEDFSVIEAVCQHFAPRRDFSWLEVLSLRQESPAIFSRKANPVRNAGDATGTGQKLWQRAKRVIPGANMLLSKRAEMFLPGRWPAYFSRAEGCRVWDLDDREFIDMSLMGIGTNTLGYGDREVDAAVSKVVTLGNMSTLNCPEEVALAERLIELHPWANMARFARSGGEALAIAVRIARATAGRHKVAICGYHGWHDWYLAANLADERNLAGHLLPGLEPNGVPPNLRGSVVPFHYNRFDELQAIVAAGDVGAIVMEVARTHEPSTAFLKQVRRLASERAIVLVFDECTSGFRQSFGGLHKVYGVEPDMATFGKALGNGYAITAIIGRREVMEAAQTSFISSTFWTERIGPAAALKTLEVMERVRSWEQITATGREITRRWQTLAARHGLAIKTSGLPALTGFTFESRDALAYKTLITQQMLAKGYLATTSVYTCRAHSPDIVNGYFEALDEIFAQIAECEQGRDVATLLEGPICEAGFRRLN